MFTPIEGQWISLRDVYNYFVCYFSEYDELGPFRFTGDECYELTWYFALEAEEVFVCGQSGQAIPASFILVHTENEHDHENDHVNLYFGTVGSGSIGRDVALPDGFSSRDEYLNALYGPFRNLPLVFHADVFDDFLLSLSGDLEDEEHNADMSPRAVSDRILQVWRIDNSLTYEEIKEKVAPQQSHRQFRLGWGLARSDEPKISRPGRRRRKT